MNNNIALSSLALDLKRIALAYHRGSDKVGDRFVLETKRWINELDTTQTPQYINELVKNLETMLHEHDKQKVAENSLMYSILFQNYALSHSI